MATSYIIDVYVRDQHHIIRAINISELRNGLKPILDPFDVEGVILWLTGEAIKDLESDINKPIKPICVNAVMVLNYNGAVAYIRLKRKWPT